MIDFSDIVITMAVGSTIPNRVSWAVATLANLACNCKNAKIKVVSNNSENFYSLSDYVSKLKPICNLNENKIDLIAFREDNSVAQMKVSALENETRNWWMNIDDDFVIPYTTLKAISFWSKNIKKSKDLGFCYGNWDVKNTRNYSDWNDTVYKTEHQYLVDFGSYRHIAHHLWSVDGHNLVSMTDMAPSFVYPLSSLTEEKRNFMRNLKKGVRGYDITIGKGLSWVFILSNAFHVGIETGLMNSDWQDKLPIAQQMDKESGDE